MSFDVTVVIVNHNTRDDLLACLASLERAAAGLRMQVIVVDNHSDDGSANAVARQFPTVRVLSPTGDGGFGHACNLGMGAARAPLVTLMNADIVCDPGCLERLAAFLGRHPSAAVVGPLLRHSDGSLQTSAYRFPTLAVEAAGIWRLRALLPVGWLRRSGAGALLPSTGHFDAHDEVRAVDYVTGACMMVRRDAVEQVGGFDEDFFLYYEEIDLCRRLRTAGWEVHHQPAAQAVHHLNRSGAQRPALAFVARQQSRLRYHAKHGGPAAFRALRAILAARVAVGELHARIGARTTGAGGVRARHYREVLRWCRRPSSLPAGRPPVTFAGGVAPFAAEHAEAPFGSEHADAPVGQSAGHSQVRRGSMRAGE